MKLLIVLSCISYLSMSCLFAQETPQICEVFVSEEYMPKVGPEREKFEKLLSKKSYKVISEIKKDAYILEPSSNAGCFSGSIIGHTCSVNTKLSYYLGDYTRSGLKITHDIYKKHTVSYVNYDTNSLLFKPKLGDLVAEVFKNKLISCEEAMEAVKSKGASEDDLADINTLSKLCENKQPIDDIAYQYFVTLREKYKNVDSKDHPGKYLDYLFKNCQTLKDRNKSSNPVENSGRASTKPTSNENINNTVIPSANNVPK